jgi:hypothetical protein
LWRSFAGLAVDISDKKGRAVANFGGFIYKNTFLFLKHLYSKQIFIEYEKDNYSDGSVAECGIRQFAGKNTGHLWQGHNNGQYASARSNG